MSHCSYTELSYSHYTPLFVIFILGVVFGVSSSSTLYRGNGAVDVVLVKGVLQGCGTLPLLSLPRVAVAAVVSLRTLLLLFAPSLLMNHLNPVIQTSGDNASSLLV